MVFAFFLGHILSPKKLIKYFIQYVLLLFFWYSMRDVMVTIGERGFFYHTYISLGCSLSNKTKNVVSELYDGEYSFWEEHKLSFLNSSCHLYGYYHFDFQLQENKDSRFWQIPRVLGFRLLFCFIKRLFGMKKNINCVCFYHVFCFGSTV